MSESKQPGKTPDNSLNQQQTYNLITDTVAGPNLRLKDNLYQGLAILVCLALGALIGFLAVATQPMGALLGGFAGMVVGLLGSGLFLMVYRAVSHASGKHD